MSMALFYVSSTRIADQPAGFVPNDDMRLFFAHANDWEKKQEEVGVLESGFHR